MEFTLNIFGVVVAYWLEFGMGFVGDGNTEVSCPRSQMFSFFRVTEPYLTSVIVYRFDGGCVFFMIHRVRWR